MIQIPINYFTYKIYDKKPKLITKVEKSEKINKEKKEKREWLA
jgi:hypothetical protein